MLPTDLTHTQKEQTTVAKQKKPDRAGGGFTNWMATCFTGAGENPQGQTLLDKKWRKVLTDAATYLLVDKFKINAGQQLIDNVSAILQKVVYALATLKAAGQPLEDLPEDIGRTLIVNLLEEIFSENLWQFDPEKDEQQLKEALNNAFDRLLLVAGLDEEHISNQPDALQAVLYPNRKFSDWKKWGMTLVTGYLGFDKEELKKMFAETCFDICQVRHRLQELSRSPVLAENEGAEELADDLVTKQILPLIRQNEELPFELTFLRKEKNKQFLANEINKILTASELTGHEGEVITQAWDSLESQLKMTLKAILAIVLTPINNQQSYEERRHEIFEGIFTRLLGLSKSYIERADKMRHLDQEKLRSSLNDVSEKYKQLDSRHTQLDLEIKSFKQKYKNQLKSSPQKYEARLNKLVDEHHQVKGELYNLERFHHRSQELLQRFTTNWKGQKKLITWDEEANKFYQKAWHTNEVLNHAELIEKLKDWKTQQATNPNWKFKFSEKAQKLLKRESFSWEEEAQQLLKEQAYQELVVAVINRELDPAKFKGCFPESLPSEKVFALLYGAAGQMFMEFNEALRKADEEGLAATAYMAANIPKLPPFIDSLLDGLQSTLEKKAALGEEGLDIGYGFLNETLSYLLKKPEALEPESPSHVALKKIAIESIRNVVTIVLADTVKRYAAVGISPEKAFAKLIEDVVHQAKESMPSIDDAMKSFEKSSIDQKKAGIQVLAKTLHAKEIKLADTEKGLMKQYRQLLLTATARMLLETLLPKKLLNSFLPAMFNQLNVWESLADSQILPYLAGMYKKAKTFAIASQESLEQDKHRLNRQDRSHLMPLIEDMVKKWSASLSELDLGRMIGDGKDKEINYSLLDQLIGGALKQNGEIAKVLEGALPLIIEAALAYHLNPQEGVTSQERAAKLVWNVLSKVDDTFEKVANLRASWEAMPADLFSKNDIREKDLKQYRIAHQIPLNTPETSQEYKACYIWSETERAFSAALNALMNEVIPEELWNDCVPKEWRSLLTRNQVSSLLRGYLVEGFEHFIKMKDMASVGKERVAAQEASKWAGLGEFLEGQVKLGLVEGAKVDPSDEASVRWMKEILQKLQEKEQLSNQPLITNIALKVSYSIIGKLLAGGFASLDTFFVNNQADPLVGRLAKLIPNFLTNFHTLNDLKEGDSLANFPQINSQRVEKYLTINGNGLRKNEQLDPFPEKMTLDEGKLVLAVSLTNQVTGEKRVVPLEIVKLIHWDLSLQAIDEIIPDADWEELLPKFLKSIVSKELVAGFASPFVDGLDKLQMPLQKEGERGEALAAKLKAEERREIIQTLDLETKFADAKKPKPVDRAKGTLDRLGIDESKAKGKAEKANEDIQSFIDHMIIDKINQALISTGQKKGKLLSDQPDFINLLLKDILKTTQSIHVKELRELIVKRAVYLIFNQLLSPAKKDAGGHWQLATERSVENIKHKLLTIIFESIAEGATSQRVAKKIVDELIPESIWKEIFSGKLEDKDGSYRQALIQSIEALVLDISQSVDHVRALNKQAQKELTALDADIQLPAQEKGIQQIAKTIVHSIDATFNKLASKKEKIFNQPLLFNELAKEAFKDPVLRKLMGQTSSALVNILLANLLRPTQDGQTSSERVREVLNQMLKDFHGKIPADTGAAWLKQFLPEELRKQIVPEFLQETLTHEFLSELLIKELVGELHELHKRIEKKAEQGEKLVTNLQKEENVLKKPAMQALDLETKFAQPSGKKVKDQTTLTAEKFGLDVPLGEKASESEDIQSFIDQLIIPKINQALVDLGKQDEKLLSEHSNFINSLLKDILSTTENSPLKQFKEVITKRAVYLILNELLNPAQAVDEHWNARSPTYGAIENIRQKLTGIIFKFQSAEATPATVAKQVVDELVPESLWKEIFSGQFEDEDFEIRKILISNIETMVKEVFQKVGNVKNLEIAAVEQIRELDNLSSAAVGGGLEEMVQTICDSIDSTLDELGKKPGKIFDQPKLFNDLAKVAFTNPTLSTVIKDTSHALVKICIAGLFQPKVGQTREERVLEVVAKLMASYDSKKPLETATAWLKEIVPEELRKEIVPGFLQGTLTHEFLADLLVKEYVSQIGVAAKTLNQAPIDDAQKNISRMQEFVKGQMAELDPQSSPEGLSGYGGFMVNLEKALVGAMKGDYKHHPEYGKIGPEMQEVLNKGIAHIMSGPKVQNMLQPNFLIESLVAALPALGDMSKVSLPDYPDPTAAQLNKLKGELKLTKKPAETKEEFKERVKIRFYEREAAQRLADLLLPGGAEDLPVPEVAQEAVYNNLNETIANQIHRVTHKDERILMAIGALGVEGADLKKHEQLVKDLKKNGNLAGKEKECEHLFKKNLVSFAMKKVEENVATTWPQPFRWLAVQFAKAITWIALKVAVSQQVWRFVSDPATDEMLRKLIWKWLTFAKDYQPKETSQAQLSKDLSASLGQALGNRGILKGIESLVAPAIAGVFFKEDPQAAGSLVGKNMVDFIASEESA